MRISCNRRDTTGCYYIISLVICLKLLIHLPFNERYGFHPDEMLYASMAKHLDWGYREGPPFIMFLIHLVQQILGESLWSLRLISTFAGASLILVSGILTMQLGGGILAVAICCTGLLCSPSFLATAYFMQPVVFDQLFWALTILFIIRYFHTEKDVNLLWLGAISGLAMLNKFTILLYLLTIFAAILFSQRKTHFFKGNLLKFFLPAFFIFLPHLIWQLTHGLPIVDHLHTLYTNQWLKQNTLQLLKELVLAHSFSTCIWMSGLAYLLLYPRYGDYRFIAVSFLMLETILIALHAKTYYSFGALIPLFAAGGICLEKVSLNSARYLTYAFFSVIVAAGLITLPAVVPVLSLPHTIRYFDYMQRYAGIRFPLKWDDGKYHNLSLYYAQMLGWEKLADKTASIYRALPREKRRQLVMLTQNYEQASALSYFGRKHQLPAPVSKSKSYFSADSAFSSRYLLLVTDDDFNSSPDTTLIKAETIFHPHAKSNGTNIYLLQIKKKSL